MQRIGGRKPDRSLRQKLAGFQVTSSDFLEGAGLKKPYLTAHPFTRIISVDSVRNHWQEDRQSPKTLNPFTTTESFRQCPQEADLIALPIDSQYSGQLVLQTPAGNALLSWVLNLIAAAELLNSQISKNPLQIGNSLHFQTPLNNIEFPVTDFLALFRN